MTFDRTESRGKVFYHPGHDCLMVAFPCHTKSHWYWFDGDPYGYDGIVAYKISTLFRLEWEFVGDL